MWLPEWFILISYSELCSKMWHSLNGLCHIFKAFTFLKINYFKPFCTHFFLFEIAAREIFSSHPNLYRVEQPFRSHFVNLFFFLYFNFSIPITLPLYIYIYTTRLIDYKETENTVAALHHSPFDVLN